MNKYNPSIYDAALPPTEPLPVLTRSTKVHLFLDHHIYRKVKRWFRRIVGIDGNPPVAIIGVTGVTLLAILLPLSIYHVNTVQHIGVPDAIIDYSNNRELNQITRQNLCDISANSYRAAGYNFRTLSYDPVSSINIDSHNPNTPQIFLELQASTAVNCISRFDNAPNRAIVWSTYNYPVLQQHSDAQLNSLIQKLIPQINTISAPRNITLFTDSSQTIYTYRKNIQGYPFSFTDIYHMSCTAVLLPNFTLIVRDLDAISCSNVEKLLNITLSPRSL